MIRKLHFCNYFAKKYSIKRIVMAACVFLLILSIPSFAATPSVAVIYPELRAPYNKIFEDIAEGVEKKINGRTKRYVLPKEYSQKDLNDWIRKNDIKVCVALGGRGEKAANQFTQDIPIVLSGVLQSKSITHPGISFAASPDKLFSTLKRQKLNIKQVIVVYNPKKSEWLMREAQSAATKHGLELITYATSSLSNSAKLYREIFKRLRIKDAAIWLPPDSTSIDNRTLLSFVLEKSWSHHVAVFSSSPAHVNKGVLFAMYPDNLKLGFSLGAVALEELNGGAEIDTLIPVEDLKTAFNKRTAEHLGVRFTSNDLRKYDAVFPSE
ncbi:MAG: ABC transporter substrate-binding protein [Gammaproteobacteria bacterium]|nr:MAG: ABC transporter substrate-binding protein [Gammaproteobacteria bacterium]